MWKYNTSRYMTKFEYAKILGIRTNSIGVGCTPNIDIGDEKDPVKIAKSEIMQGKCELIICRTLPDGTKEDIPCSELILPRDT